MITTNKTEQRWDAELANQVESIKTHLDWTIELTSKGYYLAGLTAGNTFMFSDESLEVIMRQIKREDGREKKIHDINNRCNVLWLALQQIKNILTGGMPGSVDEIIEIINKADPNIKRSDENDDKKTT